MNSYCIGCPVTHQAALIDSGGESEWFVQQIQSMGYTITHLLQTHAHIDHVAGLGAMKRLTGASVWLHPEERPNYQSAPQQANWFGFQLEPLPEVDERLADGQEILLGEQTLTVLATPGHTAGGVCFLNHEHKLLFSGDTLFNGSVGRTDLPGGDWATLQQSLTMLMTRIPNDYRLYAGHGPSTTMGTEKKSNPFLLALS
jgi:glyoxylase-like metal-dependent hydrolase (beta-lactamase superfamily II)